MILRETAHTPVYYFPREDVNMERLIATDHQTHCPHKGDAAYWTVEAGGRHAEKAVWGYPQPIPQAPPLSNYVAFYWDSMDMWFEEDEQVFVHARDPFTRVDVLPSSRNVKVRINDAVVAQTDHPTLLFETGLPTRYYIPKVDVRMDLLVPSDTITRCPYKGEARYYSVKAGDRLVEDIAWYYSYPTSEVFKIASLVCFYQERLDSLYVDGRPVEKPKTPWA
jgi:uncharacterized protein (DUF427 family)